MSKLSAQDHTIQLEICQLSALACAECNEVTRSRVLNLVEGKPLWWEVGPACAGRGCMKSDRAGHNRSCTSPKSHSLLDLQT